MELIRTTALHWLLVCSTLFAIPVAQAETGAELLKDCEFVFDEYSSTFSTGFCLGFVLGVAQETGAEYCVPKGVKNREVAVAVEKYLLANRARLNEPAADLVREALVQTYFCYDPAR